MSSPPTLLALHGNGGGGFRFEFLHFPFPFLAPTLPGFGGGPAFDSLEDYAHYIHQLLDGIPAPRILLGTGIGGSFILEYLQHYPNGVEGVILHAPVGARLDRRWFPRLMSIPLVPWMVQRLLSWGLLRPFWERLFFQQPDAMPLSYRKRFFQSYGECEAFSKMFEFIDLAWWKGLEPSQTPAVLLWGARERMLKVEQLEDFRRLLPRSEKRVVDGWDHFPMLEQPDSFQKEIEELVDLLCGSV